MKKHQLYVYVGVIILTLLVYFLCPIIFGIKEDKAISYAVLTFWGLSTLAIALSKFEIGLHQIAALPFLGAFLGGCFLFFKGGNIFIGSAIGFISFIILICIYGAIEGVDS